MAAFLLFVYIFANQVIGGLNAKLPPPSSYGNTITILSIDGGGIKGIVPSVVLQHLENALKIVSNDKKAALANYFDVIAGTSTGGLIATMLAAPSLNNPSIPAFTAKQILQFYLNFGPSIFNQTTTSGWDHTTRGHSLMENSYTLKCKLHPIIFSSLKLDEVPSLDVKLSDISIGTSALPILLPPYYFKDGDNEFHLIDGGIAAGNPALVAVSEVIQQLNEKIPQFIPVNPNEPIKLVLLSLGCGNSETQGVDARIAKFFSFNDWIPLILTDLATAAADINEYHLASVFPDLPSSQNYYLRVQEYNLDPSIGAFNATKRNMDKLVKAGQDLLEQTVKIQNVTSFVPLEKPSEGTNAEALERLAKILYNEKQYRLKMKSVENGGQPSIE
ncbi:hypothetical protein P8452_68616 [Trifolium repens]|nr:hypothetical protein P8452_68616 [Trifolium repens]